MLYDDDNREAEIDFVLPSVLITSQHIARMREDAGGLICCALPYQLAEAIDLPYLADLYDSVGENYAVIAKMRDHQLPYGAKSAFSASVNHVDNFTGITDWERAKTVNTVGQLTQEYASGQSTDMIDKFGSSFRIPGHVPLLIAREGLLAERQGHTELGLTLCQFLDYPMSTTICEMMSSKTNKAVTMDEAEFYSKKMNFPLIEGRQLIELWNERID